MEESAGGTKQANMAVRQLNTVRSHYWIVLRKSVEICCVSVQLCILQRSIWRLQITSLHHMKSVPVWRLLQRLLLLPVSGGCTSTILRGLTYPKILCTPKKEERKRENGDIAWRRSSLSRAWAAEIVLSKYFFAPKHNQSMSTALCRERNRNFTWPVVVLQKHTYSLVFGPRAHDLFTLVSYLNHLSGGVNLNQNLPSNPPVWVQLETTVFRETEQKADQETASSNKLSLVSRD